ncbi:hypothetical protein D3C85_1792540 [compost metagenome]
MQGLLLAIEQGEAGHFEGNGFLGQAQVLLVAAESGNVDAVAVGFVLHVFTPFVASSYKL